MPAKSKKQYRFMKAVEGGYIKPKGLSKSEAKEYTEGQSPKNLPESKGSPKQRFKQLKKKLKKS